MCGPVRQRGERQGGIGEETATPTRTLREQLRPRKCEEQKGDIARARGECLEQVEQAAVGPMDVFEQEQRRLAGGECLLVQLPARTLARRKAAGRLEREESDRLLRASRVFGRALELFEGDADAAREWLLDRQPLLGGLVPLELATTDVGAAEVERLIGRLEHGIPA